MCKTSLSKELVEIPFSKSMKSEHQKTKKSHFEEVKEGEERVVGTNLAHPVHVITFVIFLQNCL